MEAFGKQGGGNTGTALTAAARLGAKVAYLGKFGKDEYSHFLIEEFRRDGVVGLLHGWPMARILEFSTAVAALKCRALGGRAGIPSMEEALAFLRNHGSPHSWAPRLDA